MSVTVRFWGARGSIPSPSPETVKYGGNTACVTLEAKDRMIILDAGSGIRLLGNHLIKQGRIAGQTLNLFITHTHWDHIQGLPFFALAFVKGNKIRVFGPKMFRLSLERVIATQMEHSYFPVRLNTVEADISFTELAIGRYDALLPGVSVETHLMSHPVVDMAYRFELHGKKIAYVTDNELLSPAYFRYVSASSKDKVIDVGKQLFAQLNRDLVNYLRGVDLLIMDAFCNKQEYRKRAGWGHSTFEDVYRVAGQAKVKQLCFFHHAPDRTDRELDAIEHDFQARNRKDRKLARVFVAREGAEITL